LLDALPIAAAVLADAPSPIKQAIRCGPEEIAGCDALSSAA
jgi:hypothetical protein